MSSAQPAPSNSRSAASPPPSVPIGVRTHAVVSGRWVAAALIAALALAAVVLILLPARLPPGPAVPSPNVAPSPPPRAEGPKSDPAESVRQRLLAEEAARARALAEKRAVEPEPARAPSVPAVAPGPKPVPAPTGPARVEDRLATQRFQEMMTRGLAQLERSDWPGAEQSFGAALKFRPADRSAADGLARAKEGGQRDALARLQGEAQTFESGERWEEALAAHQRAAAIDPAVDFARQGAARSERMIQLHARIDAYLASPDRLYSPRVREEAQQLLASIERETAAGPRLTQARERLAAALKRATTTITVRLASDNATEVTLFRVGPLGHFQDREIALTPGTYTLVGSRPGYKDVRVEVIVDPDSPAPRVFVACQERV
jgi:tetratricopeptide (TPR) repeat protein